jgi:DNA polymerase III epsilon subunit-like protein
MALIIDVETTGLPSCDGLPFGIYPIYSNLSKFNDARVVQVSMMLCNENLEQINFIDFIIKSDGFSINNAQQFHGITNEISATQGVDFRYVAGIISSLLQQVSHVIAHNADFDICILKSELYRYGLHSIITQLETKHIFCSMKQTKMIVNIRNNYGIKYPKLAELYYFVFKIEMKNAHNSKYDVINLHSAIKKLFDRNKLHFKEDLKFLE